MMMLGEIINSGPFMPHGNCYLWTRSLVALHAASDTLITLAYYSIPLTLFYFVRHRKDLQFHSMFVCFAAFILACGTTHLMEVWNIWHGNYWVSGGVKAITALVSVPTAVLLVKLVPHALALPSSAQLNRANVALQSEIAERKRIEAELRKANERLEALAESQRQASLREISDLKTALDEHAIVAITDPQGKISYANDKFCAISKYTRDELLGQDHRVINSGHHSKSFIRDLWNTIAHGRVWHGEICNRAKDGSFYWVDTTIVPFLNEHGKPRQYIAIRADITTRKLAEEQVQQMNQELEQRVQERTAQLKAANQELESFSYSVSHDLRAPLRGMNGYVRMLQEDYSDRLDAEANRLLGVVSSEAQRMGQLIDDLLAFSRLGRQQMRNRTVDMTFLAQSVFNELTHTARRALPRLELKPLPHASADPAMMRHVFANLIGNAIKFTSQEANPTIEIGGEIHNGEATYFVKDNGVGFDERHAHKLFGVFQRLHSEEEFEGTGVGLALVQRVIHRHSGRIWAEGRLNEGATFYFTLPARAINPPAEQEPEYERTS